MGLFIKIDLGNIPDLLLNREGIRQLIFNLIRNSLEDMPSGETVTVKTWLDERLFSERRGNYFLIFKDIYKYLSNIGGGGGGMTEWNASLLANKPTLYFLYGLAFFLLGFAISIQLRKTSRLTLARSLLWLALFAFIHGLAEWGYLFIPLSQPFMSGEAVQALDLIQVLMWVLSFIFLLCFGLSFWQWSQRCKLITLPLTVIGIAVVVSLLFDNSLIKWVTGSGVEIFARYLLCTPGAILAAVGLFKQREELAALGSKRLLMYLYVAVISFVAYSFAGGLVVPKTDFFPANFISVEGFRSVFGFPVEIFRASLGAVMAFSILKVLRMFDLEDQKRLSEMRRREALAQERERISRDLHDG